MPEEKTNNYDAGHIQVLEGLSPVRKRPSMYIGSTDKRGLHHLVYEVIDNSIDEAMAGFCKNIIVSLNSSGTVTVKDDGRGIPVDIHPKYKKSGVEIVMTKLHAGGKFDKDSYKVSGGLHGVGVSVVNALSEWLEVKVKRGGKVYFQRYNRGSPEEDLNVIDETDEIGTGTELKSQLGISGMCEKIYNPFARAIIFPRTSALILFLILLSVIVSVAEFIPPVIESTTSPRALI